MAWLRVDDRFPEHRKIVALPRSDRWTWLEVLCYCARHGNGHVPAGIDGILRYVTPRLVERFVQFGLLDVNADGSYEVHDWAIYNAATSEERVAAYLESNPEASANEVWKAVGGRRDVVLRLVSQARTSTGEGGTQGTSTGGTTGGSRPVPLARARGPHPNPSTTTPAAGPTRDSEPVVDAAAARERLRTAGWSDRQIAEAQAGHLELAIAHLDAAQADPTSTKPGALAWQRYQRHEPVPEPRSEIATGAVGTRSITPDLPHVCPQCGIGHKTEAKLAEHVELIHEDAPRDPPPTDLVEQILGRNGPTHDPEPELDPEPILDPEPQLEA